MLQMKISKLFVLVLGEKESDDKDLNSEAPSSLSEATSEKDTNSISQNNTVSSTKEEECNNSVKKVHDLSHGSLK